jgi:hypothetical protein
VFFARIKEGLNVIVKHHKNQVYQLLNMCKIQVIHNVEQCTCERFVNLALSQGSLQTLLKSQIESVAERVENFTNAIKNDFSESDTKRMWVNYTVRVGMKG